MPLASAAPGALVGAPHAPRSTTDPGAQLLQSHAAGSNPAEWVGVGSASDAISGQVRTHSKLIPIASPAAPRLHSCQQRARSIRGNSGAPLTASSRDAKVALQADAARRHCALGWQAIVGQQRGQLRAPGRLKGGQRHGGLLRHLPGSIADPRHLLRRVEPAVQGAHVAIEVQRAQLLLHLQLRLLHLLQRLLHLLQRLLHLLQRLLCLLLRLQNLNQLSVLRCGLPVGDLRSYALRSLR